MNNLYSFDMDLSLLVVCGIDEAGRGCLAGPVYAGAAILDMEKPITGLNDSKKLNEKKRELVFEEIISTAVAWAAGFAAVEEIAEINILNAAMLAMRRAYDALAVKPGIILIDGNCARGFDDLNVRTLIGGDAKSASIAAGSVIAKVSRDRYMREMDTKYPGYGFAKHKGYGTKEHIEAIKAFGVTPLHRMRFLGNIL